jgi:CheY-like chemotaxis protein
VLIVDDHEATARLVAALLRSDGHRAVCAAGGAEALLYVEQDRPDVVVLDVMMPGMDGLEVLARLRRDARFASIPVLMYSALLEEETRARALAAGAQGYMIKGQPWPEVQATIERHLLPPEVTAPAARPPRG